MKNILSATLLAGALFCGASLAQSTPSPQNPSAPPTQPEAQPATNSPEQPAAAPVTQPQQPTQGTSPSTAATSNPEQATSPRRIAPGSVIPVQLTKTIDAKKAKAGDEVVAKVTMDMKTNSGEVIVPKDTKVMGHVTEAQARNKEQKVSQVGIAFDRAILKDGEVSMPMSIQAVIAPPSNNENNVGGDQSAPATGGSPASSPMGSGHSPTSGAAAQPQPQPLPSSGTDASSQSAARPPINGNTQGVIGISNLKLEPAQTATQGSVLSSEKNNVKVESGTMLLLKVNP